MFAATDLGFRAGGVEPHHVRQPGQRVEPEVPRVAPGSHLLPPRGQRHQHHNLLDVLPVSAPRCCEIASPANPTRLLAMVKLMFRANGTVVLGSVRNLYRKGDTVIFFYLI